MAWYLRKAVSVGPIRFNLSKSGVGASAGVTGFRIGMRPDGSSYVHAGRHGLYMREELRGRNKPTQDNASYIASPPTQRYEAVNSRELSSPERKELLDRLNKSYKDFRLDYLAIATSVLALAAALLNGSQVGMVVAAGIGSLVSLTALILESRRRTIKIMYDFESEDTSSFLRLVEAVSALAKCERTWAYVDSTSLTTARESKINAGASALVNREPAAVGAGTPPWVETNVTIPTIKARGTTVYFMPDCILFYDKDGVGCVEHASLSFSDSVGRFIEEGLVPLDAVVVDYAWKYANKGGGPDRRFKGNVEIPICLYGELDLSTATGLLCHLQTSKDSAPAEFAGLYSKYLSALDSREA